jgi:hypothetical protein
MFTEPTERSGFDPGPCNAGAPARGGCDHAAASVPPGGAAASDATRQSVPQSVPQSVLQSVPEPALQSSPQPQPLSQLEAEITELSGHLNAASHRWLVLIAEFDRREGWADGGFTRSCAHWLAWKCGIDRGAAREKLRVARALEGLPAIGAAMARGELSYSKVRALSRVATAATEASLLRIALHGTADHVERVVRGLRRAQQAEELSREARQHAARSATLRWDDDGSLLLQARLGAEAGAVVLRALEAAEAAERAAGAAPVRRDVSAETRDGRGEGAPRAGGDGSIGSTGSTEPAQAIGSIEAVENSEPTDSTQPPDTPAQRRADALLRLAEGWLAHGGGTLAGGERQAIVVHVDAAVLAGDAAVAPCGVHAVHGVRGECCGHERHERHDAHDAHAADDAHAAAAAPLAPRCEIEHGPAIAAETARRLACDASVVRLVHDAEGRPLEVGRSTRTVPAALGRALRARDDARCRYPGCTHRHALDAHHIRHWVDGGATGLSNLVLLCRRHHRQVHEGGTRIERLHNGTLRFVDARGRTIEAAPPTAGTLERLLATNSTRGIRIDAATATGLWCGEDLDLEMAVDGLCREQARGSAAMPVG